MPDCVVCSYPMIHVANGNLKDVTLSDYKDAKKVVKEKNIDLKEGETPVGCYVCPECGFCTWLET